MHPPVSILVSTTNRHDSLKRLLASLEVQDYPLFEVVVVVGPCDDNTHSLLRGYDGRVVVRACPDRNLARSRNIGLRAAAGELVALIDDDAVPDPLWLRQLVAAFQDDSVGASGGKTFDFSGTDFQAAYSWTETAGRSHVCMHRAELDCLDGVTSFPYPIGTNAMFRRSALMSIQGFDQEIEYCHDETDVTRRLSLAGYRFEPSERAYVIHEAAPSHLRATSEPPDRYPVLKNWMYFALKHGVPTVGAHDVLRSISEFAGNEAEAAYGRAIADGPFDQRQWDAFLGQLRDASGRALGRWYINRCQTIPMDHSGEASQASDFRPFQTSLDPQARLQVAVLMPDYGNRAPGGIERVYRDISRELAARGHGVHVLTGMQAPEPAGVAPSRPSVAFQEDGRYWLHRVAPSPELPPAGSGLSRSAWAMAAGVRDAVRGLRTRGRVDAVLAPNWGSWGLAIGLENITPVVLGVYTPLARIVEVDDRFDATDPETAAALRAEAIMLSSASALALTSGAIEGDLHRLYAADTGTVPVRAGALGLGPQAWHGPGKCGHSLGICRSRADALSARLAATSESIDILFVGRHEPRKGLDVLLDAFERIASDAPASRLIVAGRDDIAITNGLSYRALWSTRTAALEASGRLVFLGEVDDCSLAHLYAAADVVVMPSRYESFGLVLLEGMAHGAVPIASDVGGIPVVVPREWGTLVPVNDAGALAAVLNRVVGDEVERERLSDLAFSRATSALSIQSAVDPIEDLLRSVAAASGATPARDCGL